MNKLTLKMLVPKNMKVEDRITIDDDGRVRVCAANDDPAGICTAIENGIGTITLTPPKPVAEALTRHAQS